jgi:DNA repair protein RadC
MLIKIKSKHRQESVTMALNMYIVLREILLAKNQFDRQKEHFWSVLLSTNKKIQYVDEVSIGSLNQTIANPREVFRLAIHKGADCLVIAHNHPSGNLKPSDADRKLVKKLSDAGKIIGIEVIDAFIITEKCYHSFLGSGDL